MEKDCWHHEKPQCQYCKKFGHVKKYYCNKNNHQANFAKELIKINLYSMLIKNLLTEKEVATWIVDVVITWPKIKASSKTLINLSMLKFGWEMAPQWSLEERNRHGGNKERYEIH